MKNLNTLRRGARLSGIALAFVLGITGARAQTASNLDTLVAAAKKEGKVVVYTGVGNITRDIAALFEKRYDIPVEVLAARSSEIIERVRTERATGRRVGDIFLGGRSAMVPEAQAGGFEDAGDIPNASRLIDAVKNDRGIFLPTGMPRWTMLINTRLVPPAEEPKSWQDALDPKWKGKILSDDPRAFGGGLISFSVFNKTFGRGFIEKLATQDLVFARDYSVSARRIAAGEYPLYLALTIQEVGGLAGLPVKALPMAEGVPFDVHLAGMLKDAPHPNAARLFLNFFLDDEAQAQYLRKGYGSVTGHTIPDLQAELKPFSPGKLLGWATAEEQAATQKLATELFK